MPKKRINIEIKPCCNNCLYVPRQCIGEKTNPCINWKPAILFIGKELAKAIKKTNAAENKQDKQQKEQK